MISHAGMDLDACRGLEFELYVKEQIQGVDQAAVIADLAAGMEGYDPETYFQHFSLLDYDHLQIARDAVGRCCALLGTTESACCGEPFLFLLTGFVANREQGKGLMRRMIARTMVALSTTGFHPSVLAARTYNPVWYRMLEGLGGLMRGAVLYPRPAPADQDPDLTQLATELAMRTNPGMPFDTQGGSGTLVLSDKPVALHTGNRFLRLQPMTAPGGEATHQQISAVANLGSEYLAAPFETRRKDLAPENITYRFVGAVDGTTLSYDPAVPGAPASLDRGQTVDFAATVAFRVRSQDDQHPFLFGQRMDTANIPGGTRPGATDNTFPLNLGDEEFVVLLPPAQFLQHYVFVSDPSFATTNLVLTRVNRGDGFADVTIDCLGVVGGWKPVGADGIYEVTTVDLVRADIGVGACKNGHHTALSDGDFGVVVWGLDSYSSYAYPAGGSARTLTDLIIPPG